MTVSDAYKHLKKMIPDEVFDQYAVVKDGIVFTIKDKSDRVLKAYYYLVKPDGDIENTNPYLCSLKDDDLKPIR